jgi:transcriptional regulator GlxA family with amidase domain
VQVAIVALEGVRVTSLGYAVDAFALVNNYMRMRVAATEAAPPAAALSILTPAGLTLRPPGGIVIPGAEPIAGKIYDLIFVPSFQLPIEDDLLELGLADSEQIGWLRQQFEAGALIAASGSGTFVLAQSGLLNDRMATVPWWAERLVGLRFPKIHLDQALDLVVNDRIATARGHAGEEALLITMVGRLFSSETARWLGRILAISPEMLRNIVGAPFGWMESEDRLVTRVQRVLHERSCHAINMTTLARECGVSERTLLRHFRHTTGTTPIAYLHRLRIELAKNILTRSDRSVAQVASAVGYNDVRFFRSVFKRYADVTPGDFRLARLGAVRLRTTRGISTI